MGRVGQNPSLSSSEPLTITHFSHIHPLQLFTPYYHQTLASSSSSTCYGCNLKLLNSSGDASSSSIIYCCSGCNFFLHESCSKLPLQITHPVDQFHALSLLPTPIYPQGFFNCNACGKRGTGFSYHCGVCNLDLHSACASMPVSRIHPTHPHQLTLTFSPPYPNNAFSCDICRNPGTNHWLYRCHHCHFDSHLSCAATNPTTLNHQQRQNTNVPQVNAAQSYIIGYPSNMSVTQQRQPAAAAIQPQYVHMTVNPMNTNNRQLLGSNSYGRSNPLQGLLRSGNSLVRGFLGGGTGGGGGGMSDITGGGFDTTGGGYDTGGGFDTGGDYGDIGDTGSFGDIGSIGDFDF